MTNHYYHKKCVQKSSANSKQNRIQMVPHFTGLILLATAVGLFSFSSGCQKNKSADSKKQQTSTQKSQKENTPAKTTSTEKNNTPATTENKSPNTTSTTDKTPAAPAIDEAFRITPGKPMTEKRYFAVRDKLKQIGLALYNYHDTYDFFVPDPEKHPEYYDKNGRLKLSWRVHLLPFLDQAELFQRFKLDEDWDSPSNAPLAKNMPDIFRSPDTPANSNQTRFRVFEGEWTTDSKGKKSPSTLFPLTKPMRIRDVLDGTANTLMAIEVGADQAIEWTKPDELDAKAPIKAMGATAEGIPVLLADGSTYCIKKNADKTMWNHLIQPQDLNVVNYQKFKVKHTTLSPEQPKQLDNFNKQLDNLKKIALAFHNYHETHLNFPPAKVFLTDGKPLLSWRVYLLPYFGETALYNKFHLKEPWDSPHNKALIEQMPDIFRFDPETKPNETQIQTFSGKNTPFPDGAAITLRDITDGTVNTLLFVKTAPDKAVPWTKPVDLPFNPADPMKAIGKFSTPDFIAAMMDGSIRYVPTTISKKTLNHLIQHNDSNVIDVDLKFVKPHNVTPKTKTPTAVSKSSNSTQATDKAFRITPGKRMTAKRYFAVRNKLRQLGLAFHNFYSAHHSLLPDPKEYPEYYDKNGRLKVSWRVHLLPFLDEGLLYNRFKLDEPWNSPTNAPLAKNMPDIFRSPDTPANSDLTRFRVFEGQEGKKSPSSVFPLGKSARFRDVRDGTSNTVMAIEVGADQAIEWTNPAELDPKSPLKAMGATAEGVPSLFVDGGVRCIKKNVGETMWKNLIGRSDGNRIKEDIFITHSMLKPEQQRKLNNFKKIATAFHLYHDKYSIFPLSKEHLTDGKPLLSWRVYLLPFLGEEALYKKFNLKEPWDSPHNKKLLDQMPDVYNFLNDFEPGYTIIMTFSGKGTPFPGGRGPRIRDITDGTSNTIMFLMAGQDKAVPWTKPEDLTLDPDNPLKSISRFPIKGVVVALMDGAIRVIPTNISPKMLKNLIQHNDGQMVKGL